MIRAIQKSTEYEIIEGADAKMLPTVHQDGSITIRPLIGQEFRFTKSDPALVRRIAKMLEYASYVALRTIADKTPETEPFDVTYADKEEGAGE